jgi:polysaccharide export outer membrane protein
MLKVKLFFLSSILLFSCSNTKLIFNDLPNHINSKIPEAIIANGDLLDVTISSLNSQSTIIFTQNSLERIGSIRNLESRKLDGYLVDYNGEIDIPIIGKIKASGLTCSTFSDSVKFKLKEYVKNPSVKIKIINFRVSILGEVNKPSSYEVLNQNISLTELISKAGGFKKSADLKKIMVIRNTNNQIVTKYLDLTSYEFLNSDFYYLKQNDQVYVKPDDTSLKFDYGIFRNISLLSLITTIIFYLNNE